MNTTPLHPHLTRQRDIIPLEVLGQQINIIGAGAIGSCTALALAKMGFGNLNVFDDDKIEVENMNCQFYRHADIGKMKVVALGELIKDFTGEIIEIHPAKYDGKRPLPGIVISAVDSMKARRMIWDAHKERAVSTRLLIDPRMGAESALTYAMRPMSPEDIVSYEKTLYTDEQAAFERCTAKATMYTAFMLSGHVAKIVKDFVTGVPYSRVTTWSIKGNDFQAWPSTK